VSNPYCFDQPIEEPGSFFNRTSELTRIASRIAADRPQSVSVVGPACSGKTSLINWLCHPEAQKQYLEDPPQCLLLRLRLSFDPPQTPQAFFERVNRAVLWHGEEGIEATYDGFDGLVRRLMKDKRKLIVFLDDFGLVTRNAGFPLDFFSFMRSLANSHDVGYLTTSWDALQRMCHTQDIEESPFFNIFTTVTLEPFKTTEARRLVEEPAAAAGQPFGEEVDWILELGGRSPYLLQVASHVAFAAVSEGSSEMGTIADRAYSAAQKHLDELWQDLSEPQRQVMCAITDGKRVDHRQEYAAESLERMGMAFRDNEGAYSIPAALVARYVGAHGKGGFLKRLFG
jgi:eukaryotic-like serine/threonine-protein kinase